MQTHPTPSAPACTEPSSQHETAANPTPYTLRFMTWQCGHHGQRPEDIPVHSIEQAQAIVNALGYAISQPGHARAALFNADRGTSIYMTDDHADPIQKDEWRWAQRTTIYHATPDELAELMGLQAAFDYAYGGELKQWDGTSYLDEMEVVTALDVAAIEAAVAPVSWYESDRRQAVCDVPPVLKPAAELLEELREAAQELAAEAEEQGGAA
ncbi:hypothetical protein ACIGHN_13485 [Acidovorax sp. NPDC077693]|uniref:hypothetical protein n=1 Tax=unclassified Acidovorax TaxID=2684926 RepID=UPI0037C9BEF9